MVKYTLCNTVKHPPPLCPGRTVATNHKWLWARLARVANVASAAEEVNASFQFNYFKFTRPSVTVGRAVGRAMGMRRAALGGIQAPEFKTPEPAQTPPSYNHCHAQLPETGLMFKYGNRTAEVSPETSPLCLCERETSWFTNVRFSLLVWNTPRAVSGGTHCDGPSTSPHCNPGLT